MNRMFLLFVYLTLFAFSAARAEDPDPAASLAQRTTPVVRVFQNCKDAVVNISSTHIVKVASPYGFDDVFEEFFNLQRRGQTRYRKYSSVGSGFVFHEAGYIITNAHVVERTAERKVIFNDNTEYEAQIVAMDRDHDLAVLKIEPDHPLHAVTLGHSADLMVGETVVAIGNPMGYQNTVTAGVVSALDREIRVDENTAFTGLIQTDASINPGNSGGPLLNVLGELIGVNSAIRGDAQNIGFAIPVDQLREALPALLDVERRYRIVVGMAVSSDNRRLVVSIAEGSPAHKAGVLTGDEVVTVDGVKIHSGIDFQIALLGKKPGDAVRLGILRDHQMHDMTVVLAERRRPSGEALLHDRLGIKATPLTADIRRRAGLPDNMTGLIAVEVDPASPAGRARFQPNDIITAIGRYQIDDLGDVGQLLESVQAGDQVSLDVIRIERNIIRRQRVTLRAW